MTRIDGRGRLNQAVQPLAGPSELASVLSGKYRLDGVIGKGSFGTLYRAHHLAISRDVAVKVIEFPDFEQYRSDNIRKRFLQEAALLADIDHVHVARVLDSGDHQGHAYIVTELLEGRTLADAINRDGNFDEHKAYHYARQLLQAVAALHSAGMVHGNIKPANVLLVRNLAGQEDVKLLDVGVASAFRDDSLSSARKVERDGGIIANPQYAAPERFMGPPTTATDVYAVGLIIWEMILGKPAVGSAVSSLCAEAHRSEEEWELPTYTGVSTAFRKAVNRAIAKQPSRRFPHAGALLEQLEAAAPPPLETRLGVGAGISEATFEERPGDLIAGKYRLVSMLGTGGFSRVMRATHVEMERDVAVKLLDFDGAVAQGGASAAELHARFVREAKMSSQLRHPNTITVYDFGTDGGGRPFIVMELVDGMNLHAAIKRQGRFDPKRAARAAAQILRSLSEAHHLGFLHRDLKPGNIMLTTDHEGHETVKVLDFGIATVTDVGNQGSIQSMQATQMGMFVGTPQYAAPEQFLGETLTPATDIYMLGLVLWEMLIGFEAITSDVFGECLKAHLDPSPWRFPESANIPAGLAQIVYGAVEKKASKRYLSASEMASDLEGWLAGTKKSFSPSPTSEVRWEPAMEYGPSPSQIEAHESAPPADAGPSSRLMPGKPVAASESSEGDGLLRGTQGRMTFDPNLDDDFEPEFLRGGFGDEPSEEEEAAPQFDRPASRPTEPVRGSRGGLASIPKFKEAKIELDLPEPPPRQPRPRPVTSDYDNPSTRSGEYGSPKTSADIDWSKFGILAGLIVVAIIVVPMFNEEPPPPPVDVEDLTAVEPMHLEEFEKSLREPEDDAPARFTSEGILGALDRSGWAWKRNSGGRALSDVHQMSYTLTKEGRRVEIGIVTAASRHAAQKMFDGTHPPVGAVKFDQRVVRVFPPGGKPDPSVSEIVSTLRDYRDEVLSGAKGGL